MNNLLSLLLTFVISVFIGSNDQNVSPDIEDVKESSSSAITISEPSEVKGLVTSPDNKAVDIKPDYSELIDEANNEKKCWLKIEKKVIGLGEKCEKLDTECIKRKTETREIDYPSEEKQKNILIIENTIDKLRNGVFIDIYNVKNMPRCPSNPTSMMLK